MRLLVVFFTLFLAACSSGGDTPPQATTVVEPPTPTQPGVPPPGNPNPNPPTTPPTTPPSIPPAGGRTPLPPWLSYCDDAGCRNQSPTVVSTCGGTCRATTIIPSVDGIRISGLAFPIIGASPVLISGFADVFATVYPQGPGAFVTVPYAPSIVLSTENDVTVTWYELPPVWGGVTPVDFVTDQRTDPATGLRTVFYRQASFQAGNAGTEIFTNALAIQSAERRLTGVTSDPITALVMPTELAASEHGEGNFSYGNGLITANYAHPLYFNMFGGLVQTVTPRIAHEIAHELFNEISGFFGGNYSCFNEGQADALAYSSGYLPLNQFGPTGLRGVEYTKGCDQMSESHDVGNCYFWPLFERGYLTPQFWERLYHPKRSYNFDSCSPTSRKTGNSLFVMFTDATGGADLRGAFDAYHLPHAATYTDALAEL